MRGSLPLFPNTPSCCCIQLRNKAQGEIYLNFTLRVVNVFLDIKIVRLFKLSRISEFRIIIMRAVSALKLGSVYGFMHKA